MELSSFFSAIVFLAILGGVVAYMRKKHKEKATNPGGGTRPVEPSEPHLRDRK